MTPSPPATAGRRPPPSSAPSAASASSRPCTAPRRRPWRTGTPQVDRRYADIERIELELARLRATGRHPDQWLAQHARAAAHGLAAAAEHQRRRKTEIDRWAQRAARDPPAHIRELLGEPPATGAKLTRAWQQLAVALERHRLQYGIESIATARSATPHTDRPRPRSPTATTASGLPARSPACAGSRGATRTRTSPTQRRAERPATGPTGRRAHWRWLFPGQSRRAGPALGKHRQQPDVETALINVEAAIGYIANGLERLDRHCFAATAHRRVSTRRPSCTRW
jgi:hypothetical protein